MLMLAHKDAAEAVPGGHPAEGGTLPAVVGWVGRVRPAAARGAWVGKPVLQQALELPRLLRHVPAISKSIGVHASGDRVASLHCKRWTLLNMHTGLGIRTAPARPAAAGFNGHPNHKD